MPQGEEAERRYTWKEKPLGALFSRYVLRQPAVITGNKEATDGALEAETKSVLEKAQDEFSGCTESHVPEHLIHQDPVDMDPDVQLVRRASRLSALSQRSHHPSLLLIPPRTLPEPASTPPPSLADTASSLTQRVSRNFVERFVPPVVVRTLRPLSVIFTPVPVTIAISLPIALVQHLKALFVDVSSDGGPNWKGPDGKPPLAFIIDTGALFRDHNSTD